MKEGQLHSPLESLGQFQKKHEFNPPHDHSDHIVLSYDADTTSYENKENSQFTNRVRW